MGRRNPLELRGAWLALLCAGCVAVAESPRLPRDDRPGSKPLVVPDALAREADPAPVTPAEGVLPAHGEGGGG